MELVFRTVFSKSSAPPRPFGLNCMTPGALAQRPGGSTEVASQGAFGPVFRPDGPKGPFCHVSVSGPAARQKWPLKACLDHFFVQMAPRVFFPLFGQPPGGSAEGAVEGLFGALFRPDGPTGPLCQVLASCTTARQKLFLKACSDHVFA